MHMTDIDHQNYLDLKLNEDRLHRLNLLKIHEFLLQQVCMKGTPLAS